MYLRPESMGGGIGDLLHGIQRELDDDPNAPDLTRTDGVGARAQPPAQRDFGIGGQILRAMGLPNFGCWPAAPRIYRASSLWPHHHGHRPVCDDESDD